MLTGKLFLALLQRHGRMPLQKGLEMLTICLWFTIILLMFANTLVYMIMCLLFGEVIHPFANLLVLLITPLLHSDEFAMHSKLSKAFKKGMPDD